MITRILIIKIILIIFYCKIIFIEIMLKGVGGDRALITFLKYGKKMVYGKKT
jgi:hypothetical protein